MTNQTAFNKVWNWFIVKKNKKSTENSFPNRCKYRGTQDRKCAIGVLIPDNRYIKDMDDGLGMNIICSKFIKYYNLEDIFKNIDKSLLRQLQMTHDRPSSWLKNGTMRLIPMEKVAKVYNLKTPKGA